MALLNESHAMQKQTAPADKTIANARLCIAVVFLLLLSESQADKTKYDFSVVLLLFFFLLSFLSFVIYWFWFGIDCELAKSRSFLLRSTYTRDFFQFQCSHWLNWVSQCHFIMANVTRPCHLTAQILYAYSKIWSPVQSHSIRHANNLRLTHP